jgi:hypothetical protein
MTSNTSVEGKKVGWQGTNRIDDILITDFTPAKIVKLIDTQSKSLNFSFQM